MKGFNASETAFEAIENTAEINQNAGAEIVNTAEALEQQEMNAMNEANENLEEQAEQAEMDKGAIGYSSDYYENEYARALKNGNPLAAENAKRNWANAKAKEDLK
ncbi:MAG: hypothetical protein IJC48_01125 [Clostridia bacterium]|nr:hypothetical protein [Clostridia bacterium]